MKLRINDVSMSVDEQQRLVVAADRSFWAAIMLAVSYVADDEQAEDEQRLWARATITQIREGLDALLDVHAQRI